MEQLSGVYAAVLTPRTEAGDLDEAGFTRLLHWLVGKGIQGFAINGATGELTRTTEDELARLMDLAAEALRGQASFLVGIGAASADASVRLARVAEHSGAEAMLLPMPCFFRYSQADLKTFCTAVAGAVEMPVLLYNLPQFTNGLDPETTVALITQCENIVGIKDSSGSVETVKLLTERNTSARRLIGNDAVLASAMEQSLLDGVVSGVACVLPELILTLYSSGFGDSSCTKFRELSTVLAEVVEQLDALPTPWGLKVLAEARGMAPPTYPMPLAPERQQQREALLAWFAANRTRLLAE